MEIHGNWMYTALELGAEKENPGEKFGLRTEVVHGKQKGKPGEEGLASAVICTALRFRDGNGILVEFRTRAKHSGNDSGNHYR